MNIRINSNNEILKKNGEYYEVIRKFNIIKSDPPKKLMLEMRDHFKVDTVLRLNNTVYFCNKIKTIEPEEIEYFYKNGRKDN